MCRESTILYRLSPYRESGYKSFLLFLILPFRGKRGAVKVSEYKFDLLLDDMESGFKHRLESLGYRVTINGDKYGNVGDHRHTTIGIEFQEYESGDFSRT